jgi:chemotaxis protein histidine kinase CheA
MSGFDLSNFLAAFFDEARDRLVSINRGLVEFESETIDEEGLVALRRDAHTIKGSALMLGVVDVGAVAHLFEDAMENLIQNPDLRVPKMTQFLYDLHDQLDERLEEVDTEPRLDSKGLKAQYEALLKTVQSGSSEAPVAKVDDSHNMIGAEEAASWKKQNIDPAEAQDDQAVPTATSDAIVEPSPIIEPAVAATPEPSEAIDTQPDIDAMMPDGMFVEDSMTDLLTDSATSEEVSDDTGVFSIDDSDEVVGLDDLDEVFTLGELDDGLDESSLEALLGDIDADDGLFVYGSKETSKDTLTDEGHSAEQARKQAEAEAAEQARKQAEAEAAEQARKQAEAEAAEQARKQAEAAAAEQARKQAEAEAAEQARKHAEAEAAEHARKQAEAEAAEQARKQAEAEAAEQARKQAEVELPNRPANRLKPRLPNKHANKLKPRLLNKRANTLKPRLLNKHANRLKPRLPNKHANRLKPRLPNKHANKLKLLNKRSNSLKRVQRVPHHSMHPLWLNVMPKNSANENVRLAR